MTDRSNVQVVVGRCPRCGATTESADPAGLDGLLCGRHYPMEQYEPVDTYYEDEAKTWEDE